MPDGRAGPLLLIGWDGADWDVITPLLDAGSLPHLERLIDGGVMGDLSAPTPRLCPLLWTSLATGRRADAHGVLTSDESDPATGGRRFVPSTRRAVPALWDILSRAGLRVHAINWPASHPAGPIGGVCVSELYPKAVAPADEPWLLPHDTIQPAHLAETLADLRVHPAEIDGATLQLFIPRPAEIDQRTDRRLEELAITLAEAASVHAAATWLLEHEPCDLLAVCYGGIERASRRFMPYHPPRLPDVPPADFDLYRDVVAGLYRFHDLMLGRLLELAGPEATALVVSDHGFHAGDLRPRGPARAHRQATDAWHRSPGILVAAGPALKRDERIDGAHLLDVAPTVLTLLGLPVGEDMEGRPLFAAFVEPPALATIPSWGEASGPAGASPPEVEAIPDEVREALATLAASGYADAPGASEGPAERHDRQVRAFNLARVHLDAGRPAEAAALLEDLAREEPGEALFALHLAQCRLALGQLDECRRLIARSFERPEDRPVADYLLGCVAWIEGRADESLALLRRAEETEPARPELACHVGDAYLGARRWEDADRAFRRALDADPDRVAAHLGLATARLNLGRPAEAVAAAREAVARKHDDPRAHYLLAIGLERLGRVAQAIRAFETCLALKPGMAEARDRLAALRHRATGARAFVRGRERADS